MKVLVVGCNGRMGKFRTSLLKSRGIEVEGVDINYQEDLLYRDFDGYVIATPLDSHKDLVLKLASGKPIFVEKPMAGSLEDIMAMFDCSYCFNTPIYVAWQRRHHSNFIDMKYDLEQQNNNWRQIKIVSYDNPTPPAHVLDIPNYIYSDYMGHDINEALWLTNNEMPDYISVIESSFVYKNKIDNSLVIMHYSGGRRIVIEGGIANPSNYYDQRLEIFTPKSVIKSNDSNIRFSFPEFYAKSFMAEIDLFIDVMLDKKEFPEQRIQNINTAKLTQQIIEASKG